MRLFRFRRQKVRESRAVVSDKVAGRMVQAIQWLQNGFVGMMNRCISGLSIRSLRVVVVVFCVLGGGASLYILGRAVFGKVEKPLMQIEPIKTPEHVNRAGDEATIGDAAVDQATYQQIVRFRKYLDSLKDVRSGKPVYDSILFYRPGLLDSMRILEEIYLSQQNK